MLRSIQRLPAQLLISSSLLLSILMGCSSTSTSAPPVLSAPLTAPISPSPSPTLIPAPLPSPTATPIPTPVPTPIPTATPIAVAPSPTPTPLPTAASEVEAVIQLTNQARQEAGLPPLQANPALTSAAQSHASDMAINDYFSHTSQDGSTLVDRVSAAGYSWSALGENISRGRGDADAVMQGWMNSPGHRSNILNPEFQEIGVGYAEASSGPYWVQVFGRP